MGPKQELGNQRKTFRLKPGLQTSGYTEICQNSQDGLQSKRF